MQCGLSFIYKWLRNKMWFILEQAEAILSWDRFYFKTQLPIANHFDVDGSSEMSREDTLTAESCGMIVHFNQ